ncbi:Thioesterase/thiol ester dehydrase-isomerase [Apiospora kogelbergensis]|uniref:Thioesterase/thiol ester dehydrase-isomerase n=1 Tax=Apiospora kogelbergensis TaxID=1337665 RepID=UPI00312F6235
MSGPGAGFEYPPKEVSWLKRDALLFAASIGCTSDELQFLFELDPNFSVFPTYPVVLPFKEDTQEVIDFYAAQKAIKIPGVPEFDARRVVDGQRLVQFLKPLPATSAGKKFEIRTKVLGVYDKGRPGTVVETQTDLVEAGSGDVYSRAVGSAFYVAQGNWGGPKGPATENFPPPKGKQPDVVFEDQTTQQTALLYRLNGDYNPLHAHPEPGKKMGFGGAIIHGLYSFNSSCHGLLQKLGGSDPKNIKEFQARFASPVKPGDKLVTQAWRTGEMKGEWEEIRFVTSVAGGKVCLSNGRALMKVVGEAKSKFTALMTLDIWVAEDHGIGDSVRVSTAAAFNQANFCACRLRSALSMTSKAKVGDRLSYDGAVCTVRYIGEVVGTTGNWIGVEWDDASRGKHNGSHKEQRYFTCKSKSPTAASFVRPTRTAEAPRSFVKALKEKYTAELATGGIEIRFSGKLAEEVGFEKIRRKQADLAELKHAILDGMRVAHAYDERDEHISDICPKVINLELSRNLFTRMGTVVGICSELPGLRSLRLNGNRFQDVLHDEGLQEAGEILANVTELALEENLMDWNEICHVATKFPGLANLSVDLNQLSSLPAVPLKSLSTTLVSLNLEFNEFTSFMDIASLSEMKSLRNLHLKGNNISAITANTSDPAPVFSPSLRFLDISYNQVSTWSFVDELPATFPGLTSLRFAHNPIYENPDPEHSAQSKSIGEDAYMITVGRLARLEKLNFGNITKADRQDAEMFYLARVGKHLATVPPSQEAEVIQYHKRYEALCELYGAPAVNRTKEINPAFLEARLITVQFVYHAPRGGYATSPPEMTSKIPKSYDIYRVKGIAGKLFGQKPLDLRLTWETGEWDPVAGFDDEVDEDDSGVEDNNVKEDAAAKVDAGDETSQGGGRWESG